MINQADTLFVLLSAAFVMLMTPGLAFFYGGMVRRKNILSVLMQCFVALCLLSLQWILFGYSLSFAPGNGFWGGLSWFGLKGVGSAPYAGYSATSPHQAFMFFQMMFAVITPALIIGAFAERMKFSAFLVFTLLWATFDYDPLCHWVWGEGGWNGILVEPAKLWHSDLRKNRNVNIAGRCRRSQPGARSCSQSEAADRDAGPSGG